MKVPFVCTPNICRSAYADAVDPCRRGEPAAAGAAEHLDVLVRRIVPLLG